MIKVSRVKHYSFKLREQLINHDGNEHSKNCGKNGHLSQLLKNTEIRKNKVVWHVCLKNHTQNVVEKLFQDPFLKHQN